MKSVNHKKIFQQISRTPVDEVFLADLKINLTTYIGQRPIENKPAFTWSFNRVAVGATVIVLCLTSSGLVYASQSSLPGTTLYPVKRVAENIRLAVTVSPSAKKNLEVNFINKRLEEVEKLEVEPKKNNKVLENALATVEQEIVKLEKEEVKAPILPTAQSTTSSKSRSNDTSKSEEHKTEKPLTVSRRNLDKLIKKHRQLEQERSDKSSTTETLKIETEVKNTEPTEIPNKLNQDSDKKTESIKANNNERWQKLEEDRATITPNTNNERRNFRKDLLKKIKELGSKENSEKTSD